MGNFKYLENVAIADAAFQAEADTLEDLFVTCAQATFEIMVSTKGVFPTGVEKFKVEAKELEDLLFDWLAELIFLKDVKKMFFSQFAVKIDKNENYQLEGEAKGEKIDYGKHIIKADVKAMTFHMLEVKKENQVWMATVILDL